MIIKRISYFSDGEKKRAVRLEDIQSHRGRGRAAVLGAIVPGMVGGYLGSDKNTRTRLKKRRELEERLSK